MPADRMILGENAIYSTDCNETGVNNNVIAVGSSGGGKTMSIIEPRLLETFNSSLVVTVTKRRIVEKYKPIYKERGYNVIDLNFVKPMQSDAAYDPISFISSYNDIKFLAASIVKANPRKEHSHADPYWDDISESIFEAVTALGLMTENDPKLSNIIQIFHKLKIRESGRLIETTLDDIFEKIESKDPNCYAINCWKTFRMLPAATAGCAYSSLSTVIDTVFTPELLEMIDTKKCINIEDIANQKTVLFITTSPVSPSLNYFINMFYAQLFKSLFEYAENLPSGKLPIPVSVLCDDFATGSRILNFPEYISIFREKGISATLLIQSESQLESLYSQEEAITIINNCDSYIYLGGMDIRTCRNISEKLNTTLDDVLWMPIGKEIVFRRGQKPIITDRYNILNDKRYQEITKQYEHLLSLRETTERG